jgi:glucokinase
MGEHYYVGFDMGGTKMLAAVLDEKFGIVKTGKIRTPVGAGNKATKEAIVDLVTDTVAAAGLELHQIAALGIAVPGPIDREQGLIIDMPNAGMHDYKLRDKLEEELGLPVVLENDVNAGTYGELIAGAAEGKRNVVGIFPGTGVGGGIVIDGALYRGRTGRAAEIGHMIVQSGGPMCGCGKLGCLEAVASKTALAKDLVHLALSGKAPTVLELAGTDIAKIKSSVIKKSYEAEEKGTIEAVERVAWYLGIGVGSCIDIFDPDLIVVGGGLIEKLGDRLMKPMINSARAHTMSSSDTPIKEASLSDDATIIGVGALAAEEHRGER